MTETTRDLLLELIEFLDGHGLHCAADDIENHLQQENAE